MKNNNFEVYKIIKIRKLNWLYLPSETGNSVMFETELVDFVWNDFSRLRPDKEI